MTKFILHGGFTRKDNELNRSFYRELVKDIPAGGKVLLCYFASRESDTTEVFEFQKSAIQEQATGKELTFISATRTGFIEEIKEVDAVYIHGGSTNKLLAILREYVGIEDALIGKTVAGSSAGAYALAKYGTSHSEDTLREGLGLLPIRLICHYESPDLPPAVNAVGNIKEAFPELELIMLHDCEWKVMHV